MSGDKKRSPVLCRIGCISLIVVSLLIFFAVAFAALNVVGCAGRAINDIAGYEYHPEWERRLVS